MNNKHLALILVGLVILCIVQGVLWMNGNKEKAEAAAQSVAEDLATQQQAVNLQLMQLANMEDSSADLITFLDEWEVALKQTPTRDSAEAQFITRIREGNLATVSQKFDVLSNKQGTGIAQAMRATVVFEDDYASLLNWLGRMEESMPALRVSSLKISRGTRAQDIRLEASFDQPIYKP